MSDYRIKINIRNNRLLSRIEEMGYINPITKQGSVRKFCDANSIGYNYCVYLIAGKIKPINDKGNVKPHVKDLLLILDMTLEEAFTEKQLKGFPKNTFETNVSETELTRHITNPNKNPQVVMIEKQVNQTLHTLLECLNPKEKDIILNRNRGYTYQQLGDLYDVSKERIRQIEAKAKRKLSHVNNLDKLKDAGIEDVFPNIDLEYQRKIAKKYEERSIKLAKEKALKQKQVHDITEGLEFPPLNIYKE